MTANRHPVDELSDIRSEMKRLKAREDEIRDLILSERISTTGDQWDVSVSISSQERVDTAALRKHLGPDAIAPFIRQAVVKTIRLSERLMPDDA
jgi:hypothetical protein